MTESWGIVVPVKRLALAKTRLAAYGDTGRQALALAFAADVVRAALQLGRVLVVTDDERAAATVAELGAEVIPDDPDAGLNPALTHGARRLRATDDGLGVATVSADLPALRVDDLRAALAQVHRGGRAFVSDATRTGTTVLAAGPGAELAPAYGVASREAHLASGAAELLAAPSLRRDVDTPDDLIGAVALGVGPHTTAAAALLGLTATYLTVRTWDEGVGGSAYTADGRALPLPPTCLQDSGFRFLRVGQRVRAALVRGEVARVALP